MISIRNEFSCPLFHSPNICANSSALGLIDRLENRVGLADELHVAILDAVVDHFHIVTGAVGSHVAAARLSFGHGGNLRIDRRNRLPALLGASRHDGRALESALLATAYSDAEKVNALSL